VEFLGQSVGDNAAGPAEIQGHQGRSGMMRVFEAIGVMASTGVLFGLFWLMCWILQPDLDPPGDT